MTDPLALEVRRLALEVRRQAVAAEAQAVELAELRRALLEKADRRTGARLVPALARLMHDRPFSPTDAASAALNAAGPAAATLREIVADLADADAGLRGFGRLLQRLRGVRFGRLRLEPMPDGRWHVQGGFQAE